MTRPPSNRSFKLPTPRRELPISLLLGLAMALLLFVLMALAQMLGEVEPPERRLTEEVVAYTPPEIEELEEEELPPPEEEEPPPELEPEPPRLSLAQLDIALDPGTGGSLAGDFAMPTVTTTGTALGTEDFVDFSDLDQMPRPVRQYDLLRGVPRRLKSRSVDGRVVLLIKLDEQGRVLDVKVDSSTLPEFEPYVARAVESWQFTPPTREGEPVRAQARLPIPIRIGKR